MSDGTTWQNRRNLDGSIVNVGSLVTNSNQSVNVGGNVTSSHIVTGTGNGPDEAKLYKLAHRIAVKMQEIGPDFFAEGEQATFNRFIITLDRVIHMAGAELDRARVENALSLTYRLLCRMEEAVEFEEVEIELVDGKLDKFKAAFYNIDPLIYTGGPSPTEFGEIVRGWFNRAAAKYRFAK